MTTIKKGSKGELVKTLQQLLGIAADGIFGNDTEAAVKAYQTAHNLTADGIVGAKTWAALTSSKSSDSTPLNIVKMPLTRKLYNYDTPRVPKYIVLHYTAGRSSVAGMAEKTRNGWQNGSSDASADFVIDDATIVQANPDILRHACWSVGDGEGRYGVTNKNSISIEMCSTLKSGTNPKPANHTGWSISDAVVSKAVALTKYLMAKYNVPIERVIRHYDASGKTCPGVVGWNDGSLHDPITGAKLKEKNNSSAWLAFKKRLC